MADFATNETLEAAWRPLSDSEKTAAELWLCWASAQIRREVPGIDDRIAGGELDETLAEQVAVEMVIRVLDNPEGARSISETIEDYTRAVQLDASRSTGALYLSDDELALLSVRRSSAFSIRPR